MFSLRLLPPTFPHDQSIRRVVMLFALCGSNHHHGKESQRGTTLPVVKEGGRAAGV